jgi:outer membrane scaffolding protein for murein synthesis (MipA/OmpV family)
MTSHRLIALSLIASALFPLAAIAGNSPAKKDLTITIGAAPIYAPVFQGSKDYGLSIFPDLRVNYKDDFFASVPDGIGYNVINGGGFKIGPLAKVRFGRREDTGGSPFLISGATNGLRGLGDVDTAIELGGFAQYTYEKKRARVEVRHGYGGHEGLIGDVSLNYGNTYTGFGPPILYSLGPRATIADADYNNTYFGINQTQSINSGLARYSADSGLVSYGVGAFALLPLTDSVSVSTFAGYDRLGAEVTDSSLIKERGSKNQFVTGMSLSYKFGY